MEAVERYGLDEPNGLDILVNWARIGPTLSISAIVLADVSSTPQRHSNRVCELTLELRNVRSRKFGVESPAVLDVEVRVYAMDVHADALAKRRSTKYTQYRHPSDRGWKELCSHLIVRSRLCEDLVDVD